MCMDSAGQDFWQGIAGMVCFCFMILGPHLEVPWKAGGDLTTGGASNSWELGQQVLELHFWDGFLTCLEPWDARGLGFTETGNQNIYTWFLQHGGLRVVKSLT